VQNSYFHQSYDYGSGGHGYGVTLGRHTTNCLVENNIFETLRHAMMVKEGANGNVFAFNYSRNPVSATPFSIPADISVHGHYPYMNLFENNIVQKISCTDYWGPAGPGNTFLRNRVETLNLTVKDHSHNQNIIANEITAPFSQISIDNNCNNILKHANNEYGTIEWMPNLLSYNLPNSLYLNNGWDNTLYSYIGPEYSLDSGFNDAKLRFDNNKNNTCYTGKSKIYINENLINGALEYLQENLICAGNVVVGKNDTVRIFAKAAISLKSGFKAMKGANLKLGIANCE